MCGQRERGRKQAYDIIAEIDAALDGAPLAARGPPAHQSRDHLLDGDARMAPSELYRGVVRLRAATEKSVGQ